MNEKIPVGISACLTGQEVRHDGGHKRSSLPARGLENSFSLYPLCPEMGAGLGAPRPAMHLVQAEGAVTLRENRSGRDHTAAMGGWIEDRLPGLAGLRGFILMQKSPSCGLDRIRVYAENGNLQRRDASGLFAEALRERYPLMPLEEAGRLNDDHLLERFVERVFVYDDWLRLCEQGISARGLLDFHTRHKLQLLAHCQASYRRLGPLLADLSGESLRATADTYIHEFMAAMARPVSRGAHVNAMLHVLGFFRQKLSAEEKAAVVEQVDAYQRGEVPLIVPMTLLRVAQRRYPSEYLARQGYVRPYPDSLGLRNRL